MSQRNIGSDVPNVGSEQRSYLGVTRPRRLVTDGGESPEPPGEIPKYIRDGLQKQNSDTLRAIASYANKLADYREAEAEKLLQEQGEGRPSDTPDEWEQSEWEKAVDEAQKVVPDGKGTLTTKTIDGRDYYYLQWREGDAVKSKYVAPVQPSDR